MNYRTALKMIASIECNLNADMRYSYDLSNIDERRLTIVGKSGARHHLKFKLKKEVKRKVYVTFLCEDFRIDFPLIKNVERFKFEINDFTKMLSYGIKSDNILSNGNFFVEF